MLNLIRRLFYVSPISKKDSGPTELDHEKMSFEERKKWRREMTFRSLRETLHSLEIIEAMYKCRVSQQDARGHYYAVMMDIDGSFAVGKNIVIDGFAGIESLITKNTFEKYGVVISGIYWRTNDSINVFNHTQLGKRSVETDAVVRLKEDFADTAPMEYVVDKRLTERPSFSPVSKEEEDAFRAAIIAGLPPPIIHIGTKEYSTDLAPLETPSSGGSTITDFDD